MALQLSARAVSQLLASIFGPSFYDDPRFGRGDLGRRVLADLVNGPHPEPWRAVALNPQPLPPKELYALALADAHIHEIFTLDRIGSLLGGKAEERSVRKALGAVADLDEICPRWPRWPKGWPPPPPPPGGREAMSPTELFVFGSRLLAASEQVEQGKLQEALGALGEKALGLSLQG
ncbi:MAG TPA: hypothetical protein DD490_27525 [Acidobacteria bacterium]|nr:hypothetical protein [Acidobacteriota bacterium]